MVDKNDIRSQDSDISLVITDKRKKWWLGGDKTLKVAVCPKCGEVSFYVALNGYCGSSPPTSGKIKEKFMPRAIRTCKKCCGQYVEYRTFRGSGGTQRGKEWEKTAKATPGLRNDCKITSIHQAVSEASIDRDYEEEIAALNLPALNGDTDWQTRRAESLRHRFFENEGNLRLAKLLHSAPQVYESVSKEKQTAMMDATRKSGWGDDFAGAFCLCQRETSQIPLRRSLG